MHKIHFVWIDKVIKHVHAKMYMQCKIVIQENVEIDVEITSYKFENYSIDWRNYFIIIIIISMMSENWNP